MLWESIITLLILVAPLVHPQSNEDKIIESCKEETKWFNKNEKKYIDKGPDVLNEPDVAGPQIPQLQNESYAIEKRQRVFECISNRTDGCSNLETNLNYQNLVKKCKCKRMQLNCDPDYKYRTIDGTCNNERNPKWGSVLSCLKRSLPANYVGVSGFRQSACGKPLPEPRFLSLNVHPDQNRTMKRVSHMFVFFGQMVTHDMTDIPTTSVGDKYIDCCKHPKEDQHPQCAPIYMAEDDPFYSKSNKDIKTCINFLRGSICDTCSVGKRIQMNEVTAFPDLSVVYGLRDYLAVQLRENGTGKLMTQKTEAGELLPRNYPEGFCGSKEKEEYCFLSGDRRVNLSQMVMSFQTILLREHNRIADELKNLNSFWDEETIYQEARKINIAQWQAIIYKEFLPLIVGPDLMSYYGLSIGKTNTCTVYDIYVDPSIQVEFNTAGFRLHSLLNGIITGEDTEIGVQRIRYTTVNVKPLYEDMLAPLMGGLCVSKAQKYDRFVSVDMTDFLYRVGTADYGLDIASINIQRGRDVGIPTYTQMVNYISNGDINIESFEDLDYSMDAENIKILKSVYCDVRDIDLWVGLNNERVEDDMIVGKTAREIIARQFQDMKKGDRFYFEHCGNFNKKQLDSLRTTTLSSLLCLDTKIDRIQRNALLLPTEMNGMVSCNEIPKVDLELWKVPPESSLLSGLIS